MLPPWRYLGKGKGEQILVELEGLRQVDGAFREALGCGPQVVGVGHDFAGAAGGTGRCGRWWRCDGGQAAGAQRRVQ